MLPFFHSFPFSFLSSISSNLTTLPSFFIHCPSIHPSIYPSIHPQCACAFIHILDPQSIHSSVHLPNHLSPHPPIPTCPSIGSPISHTIKHVHCTVSFLVLLHIYNIPPPNHPMTARLGLIAPFDR
jgi:hypothetical protein